MTIQDILDAARRHAITRDIPSPDFFEGALLGNGDLGAVVCTRPDAVVVHLGHNSVWDRRIEESHRDKVKTFREIWDKIQQEPGDVHEQQWYQEYVETVTASYHDHPYPRPYPASSLYLFFDRKEYEVLGHSLDLSCGLLTVTLLSAAAQKVYLQAFVSQEADDVYLRTVDETGRDCSLFYRARLVPHREEGIPEPEERIGGFLQRLPGPDKDEHGFCVRFLTGGEGGEGLERRLSGAPRIVLQLRQGCLSALPEDGAPAPESWETVLCRSKESWHTYWGKSGVLLADSFLEQLWYRNTYFLRCVLSAGSQCPGLFGNWLFDRIGTKWHGDYHLNYNTQQIFWGLMAANRLEQHLPYLKLAEQLLPLSKAWAKNFYELDGACYPHSAYPVPMTVMPYPSPDWGWEIFETPWAVQSLWWHYTYTKDKTLLRERIYPLLREAAAFLVAYMMREGADPAGDGKYHLFPTIVPELYGLTEGFRRNLDGTADLTLTKFVFQAVLQAADELELHEDEELRANIRAILSAFPEYPTAPSRWGEVCLSVANEDPDRVVYNCPANLMHVFPGEDVDACSGDCRSLAVARNSWRHHYNEGGNDLVFYYLIGARLGILDLEQWKRHVRYCLLPNGTAADLVTLTGGRYPDTMDMKYMERMGIWVENFSLYAIVDECLLSGHTDVAELFPNWDLHTAASFCSLRTKGAFLVDAACSEGRVTFARIVSERGGVLRLKNPWRTAADQKGNRYEDAEITVPLREGEELMLTEGKEAV